jgi:hypothetical protein
MKRYALFAITAVAIMSIAALGFSKWSDIKTNEISFDAPVFGVAPHTSIEEGVFTMAAAQDSAGDGYTAAGPGQYKTEKYTFACATDTVTLVTMIYNASKTSRAQTFGFWSCGTKIPIPKKATFMITNICWTGLTIGSNYYLILYWYPGGWCSAVGSYDWAWVNHACNVAYKAKEPWVGGVNMATRTMNADRPSCFVVN